MTQTIGALIDRLQVVNLKMWWAQEQLYEIRRMKDAAEFKARYGTDEGLDELWVAFKKACDLNVQRAGLVDAVDQAMDAAIKSGSAPVALAHKTY